MEELEVKKIKRNYNILIVLIIILILSLGVLSYYTFFMRDNAKEETNNVKNEESNNLLTQNQINTILADFAYENLLTFKDKNSNNLTEEELLYIGYTGLSEEEKLLAGSGNEGCDLSGDDIDLQVKCLMRDMKLSDEKIQVANTKLWENIMSGSTRFEMVAKDTMSEEIKARTGKEYVFEDSFVKSVSPICGGGTVIYDKNIDMITIKFDGGCAGYPSAIKTNGGYKDGENYVVSLVKGTLEYYDEEDGDSYNFYYKLYADSNPKIIIKDDISGDSTKESLEALVLQYKDQLDNYNITFKKVGSNYQFVSIDYLK